MEKVRSCPKCKKTLPLSKFNRCKSNKSGYKCYCKRCQSMYQTEWRKNNEHRVRVYRDRDNKKRSQLINPKPKLFKSEDYKQCATCNNVYERKDFPVMGSYELLHCRKCYRKRTRIYRQAQKLKLCTI